jgi:hypothetical protein
MLVELIIGSMITTVVTSAGLVVLATYLTDKVQHENNVKVDKIVKELIERYEAVIHPELIIHDSDTAITA